MTSRDGWTIHRFLTVDSTQHVAADLVARGTPHRTAVIADRQTAGYGRKGDRWLDAPGDSLLATLILRPQFDGGGEADGGSRLSSLPSLAPDRQAGKPATTNLAHFAMVAALASIDAINETTGGCATIKWPNDLLLGGRKVGGILGDATWSGGRLDALRIGIGVNVRGERATFMARGLPDATSITAETGRDLDRDALFGALLRHVATYDDALTQGDAGSVVAAWRASVATIGQRVIATLRDGYTVHGIAADVADDGDLLVADGNGAIVRVSAASVQSLRPSVHHCIPDRSP